MCASWKSAQQQAGIVTPWHNEAIGSMRSNCWNTISNSFRKIPLRGEPVTITQGNALDLSAFESNTYEITLLLGPMYHLFTTEDQLKALSEAFV